VDACGWSAGQQFADGGMLNADGRTLNAERLSPVI
jgi:hypothetical protein